MASLSNNQHRLPTVLFLAASMDANLAAGGEGIQTATTVAGARVLRLRNVVGVLALGCGMRQQHSVRFSLLLTSRARSKRKHSVPSQPSVVWLACPSPQSCQAQTSQSSRMLDKGHVPQIFMGALRLDGDEALLELSRRSKSTCRSRP